MELVLIIYDIVYNIYIVYSGDGRCERVLTLSISQSNVIGRDGLLTPVLTPVSEGVYAMQYENKDAEVQTIYS